MTRETAEKIVRTAQQTTELAQEYTKLARAMEEETGVLTCETLTMQFVAYRFHLLNAEDVRGLAESFDVPVHKENREIYTHVCGIKFFALNK